MLLCYKYISMLPHICLLMLIDNILDRPKFELGAKLTSNENHGDRMKHYPGQEQILSRDWTRLAPYAQKILNT